MRMWGSRSRRGCRKPADNTDAGARVDEATTIQDRRNQQIDVKATSQVIKRLYKPADAKRIPLGELLEQALDALEKRSSSG
jgi:hypothetical protein